MGREVRRVPPNWEHPKEVRFNYATGRNEEDYKPLYNETYADARDQWMSGYAKWYADPASRPSYAKPDQDYWEAEGPPPERDQYIPYSYEEATWFQLYQTVSEGTPVSPPFATEEELIAYLAEDGDFFDQERGHGGWGYERAKAFVGAGWAPSLMIRDGEILESRDIPLALARNRD